MESTVHPQYPVNLTRDSRLLKATYKHTNKNFKQQIINKIHGVFEYVLKQKKQKNVWRKLHIKFHCKMQIS